MHSKDLLKIFLKKTKVITMNFETFTSFLGYCSIINMSFLLLSTFMILVLKKQVIEIHSSMFGIKEKKLPKMYFKYLANFKLLVIVFNITPYLVLKFIL
ncbi:DUF6868 family protein [Halobacteriovorax sp. RT-2-2]|uniref:DUF6868 family protein n=2 Tax=Halobacteriovorax TaxID=1652133 RepID=UPI0039A48CDF